MKERRQVYSFYRQLAILLKAGFSLMRSLGFLAESGSNRSLIPALRSVIGRIEAGGTFWGALEHEATYFSTLEVQLIRAGEESGKLPIVLDRLADSGMRHIKLRNQIATVAVYPCLVMMGAVLLIVILSVFVLPNFVQFYGQYRMKLPLPARITMKLSHLIVHHWVILALGVLLIVVLIRGILSMPPVRYAWDSLKLRYTVLGPLTKEYIVVHTCGTLSMLLESGINLIRALELVRDGVPNRVVRKTIDRIGKELTAGHGIEGPLRDTAIFPRLVVDMIASGVEAGSLPENLEHATEIYQEQLDTKLHLFQNMTEPALVLVVGAVVMFVVFSFFLTYVQLITKMAGGY